MCAIARSTLAVFLVTAVEERCSGRQETVAGRVQTGSGVELAAELGGGARAASSLNLLGRRGSGQVRQGELLVGLFDGLAASGPADLAATSSGLVLEAGGSAGDRTLVLGGRPGGQPLRPPGLEVPDGEERVLQLPGLGVKPNDVVDESRQCGRPLAATRQLGGPPSG